MATELIRYHAVKLGSGKPRNNCARCGDSVRRGDDHLRAHMHGATILFHWRCFFAQMIESNQPPHQERRGTPQCDKAPGSPQLKHYAGAGTSNVSMASLYTTAQTPQVNTPTRRGRAQTCPRNSECSTVKP